MFTGWERLLMMSPPLPLAVLVPVYNRPDNVAPLIESFIESKTPGRLIFISEVVDVDEQIALYKHVTGKHRVYNVKVLDCHTWPQKINFGIRVVNADWYLLGADDIQFTKGWWAATAKYRDAGYGLIGTNDHGNPRVQDEQLVIHPLISREYAQLGLIDDPDEGPINEQYHHWCCDDELLWTAKLRGAYKYAPEAHIIHNHPYWDRGQMDDTYRHGEAHSEEDLALWRNRATNILKLDLL